MVVFDAATLPVIVTPIVVPMLVIALLVDDIGKKVELV